MALTRTVLTLSKSVAATTEDSTDFTPATGDFFITTFHGEAAYDTNCAVKLIWDFGGTEEILWSTKGSAILDIEITRTGDGVKKLALTLDNGLAGAIIMSGMAKIVQET